MDSYPLYTTHRGAMCETAPCNSWGMVNWLGMWCPGWGMKVLLFRVLDLGEETYELYKTIDSSVLALVLEVCNTGLILVF
jgi:hypothetical protein